MGTRNITRVILNGQMKVNQYCQWDGYPDGRGIDVLTFMRDILICGRLRDFKYGIEHSSLVNLNDDDNTFYTGAPYYKHLFDLLDRKSEYEDFADTVKRNLMDGKITEHEANYLMVASRDIGNDVLPYMVKYSPSGMIFYTSDYLTHIGEELDWQIEGMFVIDLDKSIVKIIYHDKSKEYDFEALEKMTNDEIKTEMENLTKSDE